MQKLSTKALTAELRKLAEEQISVTDAGDPITRAQALADLVWKMAIGWTELTRDSNGTQQQKYHPPVQWAIQFLMERIEGKPAQAVQETESGIKAAEKVRDLAKDRVNGLTAKLIGPPKLKPANA